MPTENGRVDRARAFLIVLAVWGAIYLPALGRPELTGSEGRRILPALTMMETGNWIAPHMGGIPYSRKPPMINWLIAASFTLTGQQSEASARLCSTLFMLASAGLLIWLPGKWLSPAARLISAVVFLTSVGLIENGRRIEIDPIYTSMTLMTIVWWLNTWGTGGSRWSLWIVPALFLACGMLTKGPLILLLYYLTVICVLAYSKQMRAMLSIQHVTAIVLSLGIPLVWVWLASRQVGAEEVTAQTSNDIMRRLMPGRIDWLDWGENALKALLVFLPWLLLVPALWKRGFLTHLPARDVPVFKGSRLSLCLGFGAIVLMPGTKPYYVLPVIGLVSVLLGWLLSAVPTLPDGGRGWRGVVLGGVLISSGGALAGIVLGDAGVYGPIVAVMALGLTLIVFRWRDRLRTPLHLSTASGALIAVLAIEYTLFLLPLDAKSERYRPVAAEINALVPDREPLYVFKPGDLATLQNLLFYVHPPLKYVIEPHQIDAHVEYLLIREKLAGEANFVSRHPTDLYSFTQGRAQEKFLLMKLSTPPVGREAEPAPDARQE